MPDFTPDFIREQQELIAKAETVDYKTMCISDYKKLGENFRRACIDNYPSALAEIVRLTQEQNALCMNEFSVAIYVYDAAGKEHVRFANILHASNWEEALSIATLNCIAFEPKPGGAPRDPEAGHANRLREE